MVLRVWKDKVRLPNPHATGHYIIRYPCSVQVLIQAVVEGASSASLQQWGLIGVQNDPSKEPNGLDEAFATER